MARSSSPRKKSPKKKHKGGAVAKAGEKAPTAGESENGDAASPNALLKDLFQSRNERQKEAAGTSSQDVAASPPPKKASSTPKKGHTTSTSAAEVLKTLEADLQYVILKPCSALCNPNTTCISVPRLQMLQRKRSLPDPHSTCAHTPLRPYAPLQYSLI